MRYDLWITQYSSALQLLFLFPISRGLELEPTAGDIKSPICKLQMYFSKFQNIFVQIDKYICWIVAATFPSHYLSRPELEPSAGGIKSPICWLGAGCHIFQRTPDFPISSRQDFFEFQKWIYWIFAIYLPFDRLTQTEASTCLML